MHLYILVHPRGVSLRDVKAAMELLKEFFGATYRGIFQGGMGIVYACSEDIPDDLWSMLMVVPFN